MFILSFDLLLRERTSKRSSSGSTITATQARIFLLIVFDNKNLANP